MLHIDMWLTAHIMVASVALDKNFSGSWFRASA
jgi:hypothetical protein